MATWIILILIVLASLWAIRRLVKRGMCDCKDGVCSSGGCKGCSVVRNMEKSLENLTRQEKAMLE